MKTRLFTLLVALFACAWGVWADGITSLRMTICHDGDVFTVEFPESGWPEQIIEGQTTSIKIMRVEAETDVSMAYVGFCATMYSTSDGWQHNDDEWRWIDLVNQGDGLWVLDMGEGTELVESKWLNQNKTKTFEFFVQAGDSNGNTWYYANGINESGYRNNYKVTFSTGEGGGQDWKVKFYKESTASLNLLVNGEDQSYAFDGDATRSPDMQPVDAYSLAIDGFQVSFIYNDNVKVNDVSIQYKVYEEGQEGGWNRINAMNYRSEDVYNPEKDRIDHRMTCSAYGLEQEVASSLEFGKNYVLEVIYQVVTADGDYFFLGKDREGSRFKFYYDTETGISNIEHLPLAIDHFYNFAGQMVNGQLPKGIIISRGKKVLKK